MLGLVGVQVRPRVATGTVVVLLTTLPILNTTGVAQPATPSGILMYTVSTAVQQPLRPRNTTSARLPATYASTGILVISDCCSALFSPIVTESRTVPR